MMKKNAIALSVAALVGGLGFAGGASADAIKMSTLGPASDAVDLLVNNGGIGHSLLFPYYTVQNGNSTLINIVNTDTVNGKAVKVRFRGASNSDDVFDFQLYLSPADVWTANISQGADGVARLDTNDKSCTLPANVNQSFVLDRLPALAADERANQTREGYIEVFTMADIPPTGAGTPTPPAVSNPLYTAIKHVGGVAPCTSAVMQKLTANPTDEAQAYGLGFTAPSTGLFGNYSIINMKDAATSWTGEATTLLAVLQNPVLDTSPIPAFGNVVFFPQTATNASNPDLYTADPSLRTTRDNATGGPVTANFQGVEDGFGNATSVTVPVILAQSFDLPDMSTPYLSNIALNPSGPFRQAQQITQAIARLSIKNEYLTDPTITASTDWIFSMPTRRYSVAMDYRSGFTRVFSNLRQGTGGGNDYFNGANTSVRVGQICVSAAASTVFDREETFQQGGFVISPGTATSVSFCGEVSVLSFNNKSGSSALSAVVARSNIDVPYKDGWVNLPTPGLPSSIAGSTSAGLPILGSAFIKATNPAISAGKSANFGGTWTHRFTKPMIPAAAPVGP